MPNVCSLYFLFWGNCLNVEDFHRQDIKWEWSSKVCQFFGRHGASHILGGNGSIVSSKKEYTCHKMWHLWRGPGSQLFTATQEDCTQTEYWKADSVSRMWKVISKQGQTYHALSKKPRTEYTWLYNVFLCRMQLQVKFKGVPELSQKEDAHSKTRPMDVHGRSV